MTRLAAGAPYASPAALFVRAREILSGLGERDRIAVINAHPRIGERPEVVRGRSLTSYREQGYDRDRTPAEVVEELARLNAAYEERFGFRFVVFVNRRSKSDVVPVLRERLARSREEELATALGEVLAIAEDRLRKSPA